MRATGIVRRVDELGRVVIPIELRRTMDIDLRDAVDIYVDGDRIILKKKKEACVFCGSTDGLETVKDKAVCRACIKELMNY